MVIGELALGTLRNRLGVLELLKHLPSAVEATHAEVMDLIERHRLHSKGLSLVDVHLLSATMLSPSSSLWTRDKRLQACALRLGIGWRPRRDGG
jgi:hypothetical protein